MRLPQINASTVEQLGVRLQTMIARINTVWAKEHTADGKHLLPQWHEVPYNAALFSVGWTVSADKLDYTYWKHGDCLCVTITVNISTLASAVPILTVQLPETFVSAVYAGNMGTLLDNGVFGGAAFSVSPQSGKVTIHRSDRANFTAGQIALSGQILLRTTL